MPIEVRNARFYSYCTHANSLPVFTVVFSSWSARNEVKEQNGLLDGMGDSFQNTRDMLGNSLNRIGTMLQSGGAKHMCYMVAFGVGVLVFVWWLMHWRA
jgi:hypothetical protein